MKPTPVTWDNIIKVVGGPVVQNQNVAITIQKHLKKIRIEYRRAKRQNNRTGHHEQVVATKSHTNEMSSFAKLSEKPRKIDVLEWLVEIDASWRGIGLDLGVSNNDLDGLAESNKSNQTKLDYVLQKWIEMDGQCTPVTWKVIVDVVKGPLVQNKAVAMEIYKSLKHQDAKQQNTPELKVNEAFLFLEEHKFKSSEWCTLARALDVPFKERRKLTASYKESKNHDWVLEETLDYWITHHPNQPSLEELTRAVEKCDTIRSSQDCQEVHDSFKKDSSKKRKLEEESLEQLEEESSKKRKLQEEKSNFINKALTVDTAFDLLDQYGFKVSFWKLLALRLRVPYEKRNEIETKINELYDLQSALEDSLYCWIKEHTGQPEWKELVDAVEKCGDKDAAIKMKEALQL